MNDDIIIIPTEHAHLIEVREPLLTKAPCPDKARPYCCYVNTVIFYLRPYIVRPWSHLWMCNGKRLASPPGQMFEEWDRVDTRLRCDDIVTHEGRKFRVYSGRVRWFNHRWWMFREARLVNEVKA